MKRLHSFTHSQYKNERTKASQATDTVRECSNTQSPSMCETVHAIRPNGCIVKRFYGAICLCLSPSLFLCSSRLLFFTLLHYNKHNQMFLIYSVNGKKNCMYMRGIYYYITTTACVSRCSWRRRHRCRRRVRCASTFRPVREWVSECVCIQQLCFCLLFRWLECYFKRNEMKAAQ